MAIMFLPVSWPWPTSLALPLLPWPLDTRNLIAFALSTPVQFWAGQQFYKGAWAAARHLATNMNTLIAVGTSVAYLYSVFITFFPSVIQQAGLAAEAYYDTSTLIIGLIWVIRK